MDTVKLHLTSAQLKKLQSKKPFRVSHAQVKGGKGEHVVEIQLPRHHSSKLMKSYSVGKGWSFPSFNDIKDAVTDFGNDVVSKVVEDPHQAFVDAKKIIGSPIRPFGISGISSVLPDDVKNNPIVKNALSIGQGVSVKGGKLKKGSPEAKAWREKMKALRGGSVRAGAYLDKDGKVVSVVANPPVAPAVQSGMGFSKVEGGNLVKGVPMPLLSSATKTSTITSGLLDHKRGTRNGLLHGGSFLPLGA